MDGGFPFARLAAALALSLIAHLLAAWGLGGLLGATGEPAAAGLGPVQARLAAPEVLAQAAPQSKPKPAAGAAPRAVPRYWPAAELDARPQIKTHVMPEYPSDLVSGIRGRVVLELYVSAEGTLDRIRVARAEPPGRFEQAAVKAFSGARFTPGTRKGKPVRSLVRIEVSFGD